ncbi:hypothetical protein AVEN_250497-1 [Araneus ventricosus]|uniref:Uncharacterized protein n=1 Tax=Araneus ventricosus TaxID=182803 RepID=A0A4Y2FHW5_ARAVE|nr:hypothetical protein AVEN_250497-1 [Araneus ventricosus]
MLMLTCGKSDVSQPNRGYQNRPVNLQPTYKQIKSRFFTQKKHCIRCVCFVTSAESSFIVRSIAVFASTVWYKMADQGDENIARPEGAEGGRSSNDEIEYELVAEEEVIDTAWESAEVYPKREFPRVGFGGRGGQHPEVPPPRVYLTDRPTSASPSRGVQTGERPQEQLAGQMPQRQEQGGQAAAATREQQQQERSPRKRRISERLQQIRRRLSRDESPAKRK